MVPEKFNSIVDDYLEKVSKVRNLVNEGKVPEDLLMCAFDMVGVEYLGGEAVYYNDVDGLYELISDFELAPNKILEYIVGVDETYNFLDMFVVFDGDMLWSIGDDESIRNCVYKDMNGEVADYILENIKN